MFAQQTATWTEHRNCTIMGCGCSTESGRRAYKNARLDTHDIFIERRPGQYRGDDAFRRDIAGAPALHGSSGSTSGRARKEKGRLALVVRRRTQVDDMHERGELGSRYWSDRPPHMSWDPYNMTSSGVMMRGGRLWKMSEEERNPPDNPPGIIGHPQHRRGQGGEQGDFEDAGDDNMVQT